MSRTTRFPSSSRAASRWASSSYSRAAPAPSDRAAASSPSSRSAAARNASRNLRSNRCCFSMKGLSRSSARVIMTPRVRESMPVRIIRYDRGTRSQLEDTPVPPSESSPPGEYLNDRIVVVTGAFGALGAAVAQAVGAAGAQVAAVGREEAAKAPAFASGVTAFGGIDLGSPDNVGSGFRSIAERLGGIDALIHISGGFRWEKVG